MKLQPCDIILVKGKGLISESIESIEQNPYSHSAIVVTDSMLIEAGWQKVQLDSIDKYKNQADIYRCLYLDNFDKARIVNYASNQLNKHYDFLMLLWELVRYKLGIILPYFNTDSLICSELINDSYESVGIFLFPSVKYPSPADLSQSKLLTKIRSI